eukprot:190853-Pleurochrysis_carterae.AAC.1
MEHVANCDKRKRQVSSGVTHHEHHIKLGRDALVDATPGGAKLFGDHTGNHRDGSAPAMND